MTDWAGIDSKAELFERMREAEAEMDRLVAEHRRLAEDLTEAFNQLRPGGVREEWGQDWLDWRGGVDDEA